jgi:hypothetical protein
MTQENFKKQIEIFVDKYQQKMLNTSNYEEQYRCREDIGLIKATIARTMRLCLTYPEMAKEYMDKLPKATMD